MNAILGFFELAGVKSEGNRGKMPYGPRPFSQESPLINQLWGLIKGLHKISGIGEMIQ